MFVFANMGVVSTSLENGKKNKRPTEVTEIFVDGDMTLN